MIDKLNESLQVYNQKWDTLVAERKNMQFFDELKPTAVGWKTEDRAEYSRLIAELHDQADLIVEKWMNGRWIAKVHLKELKLTNSVEIVKIMERRPGSTDAVGLDHIDFYSQAELARSREVLSTEPNLKWTEESNDVLEGYDWLSVWFDGTEAKIKSDTVLDIVVAELNELNSKILSA